MPQCSFANFKMGNVFLRREVASYNRAFSSLCIAFSKPKSQMLDEVSKGLPSVGRIKAKGVLHDSIFYT